MFRKKLLIIIALTLGFVMLASYLSMAVWDPEQAVTVDPDSIEEGTLIIGTHLIYVGSLTNQLYGVAVESAAESGQGNIYYKSELAGGTWFDITSASTLRDITTGGNPVEREVIAGLLLTHHTKSDGITYDLRTGEAVSVFDIRDPYELESMPELLPLKIQLDLALEMQADSKAGRAKILLLESFFQTPVTNRTTEECDKAIDDLQRYYDVLSAHGGGAAEMETVQEVQAAADAARRAEVMGILEDVLNEMARDLRVTEDPEPDPDPDSDESGASQDSSPIADLQGSGSVESELLDAINESISNVMDSLLNHSGKMLSQGVTVMSGVRYEAMTSLIDNAGYNNHSGCDADVADLISLDNIQNGRVADPARELELLDDRLISRAAGLYRPLLGAGENAEYKTAVANNAAAALKNGIVQRYKNDLTIIRGELEFFIDARCERISPLEGIDYVDDRLSLTNRFFGEVPNDGFAVAASESIDAHIDFLMRLKRKLELRAGGNDGDKLAAEKAALQEDLMDALDRNDLAEAKAIEQKIAAIDDQLNGMGYDGSGLADTVADLLSDGQNSIANSDGSSGGLAELDGIIDALGGLLDSNYGLVFGVLEKLHGDMARKRDLEDNDNFGDAIDKIEQILMDNKAAYDASQLPGLSNQDALSIADNFFDGGGDGLFDLSGPGGSGLGGGSGGTGGGSGGSGGNDGTGGGSGGTGGGDGTGGGAGGTDGNDGAGGDGAGGGSGGSGLDPRNLTDSEQKVVLAVALSIYRGETGDSSLDGLMAATARQQFELGNFLVYHAIQDTASRYLPAYGVAQHLSYRYVWNPNNQEASLARGMQYYSFRVYSEEVITGRDKSDALYMLFPARYQNGVHLPESFAFETFGLWAVYIPGTEYGVLVDQALYDLACDLFAALLRGQGV